MRKKRNVALQGAAMAAAAVVGVSATAGAQTPPLCSSFNGGNVVYFSGSTAVQPVLQKLANSFAAATPAINIGIVYHQGVGSCQGNIDLLTPTPQKASAVYLDPTAGKATSCTLTDPANGQVPDVAVSDVFPATCTSAANAPALGAGFKEFVGPIQVFGMVARKDSTESSISANAAYVVFGFAGGAGVAGHTVAPWTDPTQMFVRKSTSGTINMIGTAIGLPAAKWLGGDMGMYATQHLGGSGAVLSALQTASNKDAAIGILAADFADQNRNPPAPDGGTAPPGIKFLAYKHAGQSCGYLPDSLSTTFDKINVRQGRYAIWGPVHMITKVDANGVPTNANVATLLTYFTSVGPTPDATLTPAQKKNMIAAEANSFTVPWCAMQVQRATEMATPMAFQPTEPCGCYYESLKASTTTSCTPCPMGTECTGSTPTCRYGFCEAR